MLVVEDNIVDIVFVLGFFYVSLINEKLFVGVGVFIIYGFCLDYFDDFGVLYFVDIVEVKMVILNFVVFYKVNK